VSEPAAWRAVDGGLAIAVRVTPRGGRDALAAGTPAHLAARLAAAPVDGAANAALIALVAKSSACRNARSQSSRARPRG